MSGASIGDQILVEQYKYVLERRKALNESIFKIVAVYQALMVLLVGFQFSTADSYINGKTSRSVAVIYHESVVVLSAILSFFSIAMIVGGIFAWVDNRNDENVIRLSIGLQKKSKIRLKDLLKWFESYVIIGMLLLPVLQLIAFLHMF